MSLGYYLPEALFRVFYISLYFFYLANRLKTWTSLGIKDKPKWHSMSDEYEELEGKRKAS